MEVHITKDGSVVSHVFEFRALCGKLLSIEDTPIERLDAFEDYAGDSVKEIRNKSDRPLIIFDDAPSLEVYVNENDEKILNLTYL